ncbi:MAG: hypothetical protein OXC55_06265, partial [Chloroflexi bacterium]|nr:hypothetical protein [Chloroflexota bacterium]
PFLRALVPADHARDVRRSKCSPTFRGGVFGEIHVMGAIRYLPGIAPRARIPGEFGRLPEVPGKLFRIHGHDVDPQNSLHRRRES